MEKNYKAKLKTITTFCFDVDGVFTNNIVLLTNQGEQLRTANVRDGYAVQLAIKKGLRICIISGGSGDGIRKRFEGLGVTDIFLASSHKIEVFKKYLADNALDANEVCYMGDDIPDYVVMKHSGLSTCPADAANEIRGIADYVSPYKGGEGCVRDVLEQAMKLKGMWMTEEGHLW
jgi:3-deoxy-D-manno-octulosonate 8-phosphate phosphatase (KDO 8-P phosphatase)